MQNEYESNPGIVCRYLQGPRRALTEIPSWKTNNRPRISHSIFDLGMH